MASNTNKISSLSYREEKEKDKMGWRREIEMGRKKGREEMR